MYVRRRKNIIKGEIRKRKIYVDVTVAVEQCSWKDIVGQERADRISSLRKPHKSRKDICPNSNASKNQNYSLTIVFILDSRSIQLHLNDQLTNQLY